MDSIALVVLDTLRKDAFDDYFDWLPGRRFDRAFSTSHRTVPAHASLFTGKYASEVGIGGEQETLTFDGSVLPEQLQQAGYTTRAFSANPYISAQFGYHRGFDEFDGSWRLSSFDDDVFDWGVFIANSQDEGPRRYLSALWQCLTSDVDTVRSLKHGATLKLYDSNFRLLTIDDGARSALKSVRKTEFGDKEFLFMNLMEAHAPYNPPPAYRTTQEPEFDGISATITGDTDINQEQLRASYEDSVRYLSDIYEDIFDELRNDFDYVITLSDHGELLGEHGAWNHSYGVFPELTHVPLTLWNGTDQTVSEEAVVSLLDIHKTILKIAGIDGDSRGQSLLEEVEGRASLTEYHGLTPRQLNRLEGEGISRKRLKSFDQSLNGLAAPLDYYGYETQDGFFETGVAKIEDPRATLKSLRKELQRVESEAGDDDLSDSVLKQLDDLGYT